MSCPLSHAAELPVKKLGKSPQASSKAKSRVLFRLAGDFLNYSEIFSRSEDPAEEKLARAKRLRGVLTD